MSVIPLSSFALPDGRRLAYRSGGDPGGFPVVVLHGTPGSSRQVVGLERQVAARGVRLIAPDRPGYGGSGFDPARTVASSARDVGALVDHLGLERWSVVGLSGGGPTALACGVVVPERLVAVATVGGVGPMEPPDPSLPPARLLTRVARRSEAAAHALFALGTFVGRRRPERTVDRFAAMLAEPDRRLLLQDAELRDALVEDFRHPAPSTARAAARDFRLFARRWDVDLGAVVVPVHLWHGTADRNVPVAHARVVAARCPVARLHVVEGGGHLLLAQLDEILAAVSPLAPPTA